jgi:NAD(P)H-hydrate epimerase
MKTVSAAEMKELERQTIADGTSGEELMRRAGSGVASIARDILESRGGRAILLIAGTGNNGGDVFAAATALAESDLQLEVWLCGAQSQVQGDAQLHLKKMVRAGLLPKEVRNLNDLQPKIWPDLIIDGLLGTGSRGAPRGFMEPLIEWINEEAHHAFVLSIDLPSGIDADRGTSSGKAVKADLTATIGLPKTGLIRPEALPFTGRIEVIDIGLPYEGIEDAVGCAEAALIDRTDLFVPRRERDTHKGHYGHVALLGGSTGYTGAIALAARAALRSGAGRVTVFTPADVYPIVATSAGPDIMVHPFVLEKDGDLLSSLKTSFEYDAVLVGPGLGRTPGSKKIVETLLERCRMPLVLDADALCVSIEQIAQAVAPVVLTPHPGEFERLFGGPVTDRWTQAQEAARLTGKIVILKGAGTLVAQDGQKLAVNLTGNPGMATAGAGDVLAGLLTGLLGQGMPPHAAAITAVYLHGVAGDIAAHDFTQPSLTATDIIESLPDAFRFLRSR